MIAKQKRSRDRVKIIIKTAREILKDGDVSDITIARVSKLSQLKRTSTYKFFPTPDHIKAYLFNELFNECSTFMKSNIKTHNDANLQSVLDEVVTILISYFDNSVPAKKLILQSSLINSDLESLMSLSEQINKYVSLNIDLPSMFNEKGVFLVLTQIIISILSLNYKMDKELNNVGKSEAIRASASYLIACTAKE